MNFLSDSEIKFLRPRIKTMQVLIGMLAMGVTFFLCISLFLAGGPKSWDLSQTLPLIGVIFSGMTIAGWIAFPLLVGLQPIDSSQDIGQANVAAFMKLQTQSIIRAALVEGGAFLNLVLYFVEGNGFNLLAALIGLFFLLQLFPTESKIVSKIESLRR